jgi:hypothetical protein
MNLDDTITFTDTAADDFGDDVASTEYETDGAVEQISAFARGVNAELQTGTPPGRAEGAGDGPFRRLGRCRMPTGGPDASQGAVDARGSLYRAPRRQRPQ